MKKSFRIILIILVFLCSIIRFNYSFAVNDIKSGNLGNNMTWTLDSSGTLTITGNGNMSGTSCAWEEYKDQVKKVVFNGNITSISSHAFEANTNIETITLPTSVSNIQTRAFAECTKLKSIEIPNNLQTIGAEAFYNCTSLQSIDLGSNIMYIYKGAFSGCTALKTVTIKSTYVSINDSEETISSSAKICGYKYYSAFFYARRYGRTFIDLETNENTTETVTNQSYLDALPTTNVKALGVTSHNARSSIDNTFYGYEPLFCNEKDTSNQTYKDIKAKVEELTANCTTDTEKAKAIYRWVFISVEYQGAYGAGASIDRIYGIFNEKRGSCEAYTMLTNYMLYLCDIPVATASNLTHEWSVAYLDGKWTYVDATQYHFGTTPNNVNEISFAYDGLVYVINDPAEGGKVTGIAKTEAEINELKSFTIPTNSYMKSIYETTFERDIELRAKLGTVGADFIKNNRKYYYTENNQIIGSNTPFAITGDINGDGTVNINDANYGIRGIVNKITLTDQEKQIGDINNDGTFNINDVNAIMRLVVGKESF